jgi:predicted deacylase
MNSHWRLSSLAKQSRHSLSVMADAETQIPFTVLVGENYSPTILVIAGVHGDEYEGPSAIYGVVEELDPKSLKGSIIFVPVANPAAFAAATRLHPADGDDLNRLFPGNPEGSDSARLAHVLFQEFVMVSESILSLHGWSKEAKVLPYVEHSEGGSDAAMVSREAAMATGLDYVHPYQWEQGLLCAAALRHGIPAIEVEIGGMGTVTAIGQALCRDVISRFLAYFQVIASPVAPNPLVRTIGHSDLLASASGLFRSYVDLGDPVKQNQLLATVQGIDGTVRSEVRAPRDGIVGLVRVLSSVKQNDLLAQLFWDRERL